MKKKIAGILTAALIGTTVIGTIVMAASRSITVYPVRMDPEHVEHS